jgi:hypothetical protein
LGRVGVHRSRLSTVAGTGGKRSALRADATRQPFCELARKLRRSPPDRGRSKPTRAAITQAIQPAHAGRDTQTGLSEIAKASILDPANRITLRDKFGQAIQQRVEPAYEDFDPSETLFLRGFTF